MTGDILNQNPADFVLRFDVDHRDVHRACITDEKMPPVRTEYEVFRMAKCIADRNARPAFSLPNPLHQTFEFWFPGLEQHFASV